MTTTTTSTPATVCAARATDAYAGTREVLESLNFQVVGRKVLIKPNLTGAAPAEKGLTVDTGVVRAVLERLKDCPVITIAESCSRTDQAFENLGYKDLCGQFPNVRLLDMRRSPIVWKSIPRPYHTREMPFAAELFEHDYVVNIAKLKTHSLAGVTLCLKNIFGCIPTRKQKLMYHPFIRKAMLDMNQIVHSDFCLVDGVWGNEFDEIQSTPVQAGVIVGGESILGVDMVAAAAMGIDVRTMDTYKLAQELFGPIDVSVIGSGKDVARPFRQGCLMSTRFRYVKEATQSICYRLVNRH
jgi:uncharacterized protein (DUF362 family)